MQILPVIDLMNGVVVRGVRGHRQQYQPLVSRLTTSVQPLDVASAIRGHFGLNEFYLADLDAILGKPPSLNLVRKMLDKGLRLWVDAGIGVDARHIAALAEVGVQQIIAGLESLEGPAQLQELVALHGASRLVFSLDMSEGKALARASWIDARPWDIARQAIDVGVRRMLVLDLAAVGANQGTLSAELCAELRSAYPSLEIATGGGIRDVADLRALSQMGIDNVLIASALHDGRLTAEDLRSF
jgi:phosphoribosylformimino-5-aminoimidazole carboxamide ribotide isomerase